MIHLLPTMAKTVERIILKKIAHHVQLEETQYGSRKNRSTYDTMKRMLECLEHNKYLERGIVSMEVEGGFDKVDIDILSDIISYRKCPGELIEWTRTWARNRKARFRFNGRYTKSYQLDKGVPQGAPLSRTYSLYMLRTYSGHDLKQECRYNVWSVVMWTTAQS